MSRTLCYLLLGALFIAVTYQTPVEENSVDGSDASSSASKKPKTKPTSQWGSYYRLNEQQMTAVFDKIYIDFQTSNDASKSKCLGTNTALYSRYYQNIDNSQQYIMSFFCMVDTGYEHLRVDIPDIANPSSAKYVSYADKLSQLGVTGAGAYHDDDTRDDTEAEKEVERLFTNIKDAVQADLPSACKDVNFNTDFMLQTKNENALEYWQFPVACTIQDPNDFFTDVEVFRDVENGWINDGALTYVGNSGLASNKAYHIKKSKESELQTAGAGAFLLSLPLMIAARIFA